MQGLWFALAGIAAGVLGTVLWARPQLATHRGEATKLRGQLAETGAAGVQLAELRQQVTTLRHDVRGILSPALLVADGLLNHAEPKVKRAGEVIVRTVERASDRLAELKVAAPDS